MENFSGNASSFADFIWKNADVLWGDFKHTDFGKVILPFTLLRRLECTLEPTRDAVRETAKAIEGQDLNVDTVLRAASEYPFYNTSEYSLGTLGATQTRQNLEDYIAHFSENAVKIFEEFDFTNITTKLDKAGILYTICKNFAEIDLHPDTVPDRVMSNIYEHLIRRFGAEVNEAAEDFMTPRDVVHLATALVLAPDNALFQSSPGLIRTLYDPTCGTGGFLTDAMNHVSEYSGIDTVPPTLVPHGQERELETHAVCVAAMLIRRIEGQGDLSKNIKQGSTLSNDQFSGERFHYCLSNPPFGQKWEKDKEAVEREYSLGKAGRFAPGLPRISDGSMLFLMHLVSKLELPIHGGGRAAIVLSGSPLFNGDAGSGESEIRRHLLEKDLVEAIICLPTNLFYRTGIATYLWILSNKKPVERKNKVQLINAENLWEQLRKNEGNKSRIVGENERRQILEMYADFQDSEHSKVLDYQTFGYRRVKVLRPLRMKIVLSDEGISKLKEDKAWGKLSAEHQDFWLKTLEPLVGKTETYVWLETFITQALKAKELKVKAPKAFVNALINAFGVKDPECDPVLDSNGDVVADNDLTDYENVPLLEDVQQYFEREVLPHVSDAWIDESFIDDTDKKVGKVGYQINFNRFFYRYNPPRKLEEIDSELKTIESEIADLLAQVAE